MCSVIVTCTQYVGAVLARSYLASRHVFTLSSCAGRKGLLRGQFFLATAITATGSCESVCLTIPPWQYLQRRFGATRVVGCCSRTYLHFVRHPLVCCYVCYCSCWLCCPPPTERASTVGFWWRRWRCVVLVPATATATIVPARRPPLLEWTPSRQEAKSERESKKVR